MYSCTNSFCEEDIKAAETELDDDAESIITNERYIYIGEVIKACYKKKNHGGLSTSDRIDRIVTNRWLGLPIFAAVMFIVYWVAMVGVGAPATDWANDGLFGDGWHLLGIDGGYGDLAEEYGEASLIVDGYDAYIEENGSLAADGTFTYEVEDEETLAVSTETATMADYEKARATIERIGEEPDPADYGIWVPGIPVLVGNALEAAGTADWLSGLILDGIVAGVGAVLGFVPQMLVLFLMLAFLEACGYMARIAFVLDRIFRKFGLSGKSFIPMLIGTGCGIPGIMASRTIENERDRRMTIMTTTFIPCGAKVPFIGMIAGALFGGSAWVSTSAYFIGMAAIIISGIMLKKTKMFAGDPAPFVMELPAYHWPTLGNVLRSMWERGWSFIKKAGTIILLSTIFVWFTSYFGWVDGTFQMLSDDQIDCSILAAIGGAIDWIFAPLGWGNWQAVVASITGLVAKENIVGTLGILYGGGWQDSGKLYLRCEDCGNTVVTDMEATVNGIVRQFRDHEQIGCTAYTPSAEVMRLDNAINRGLEQPDSPEAVMALILQGAAARYACCPEPSAESELSDSLTDADWRRFQRAVSHITISQDTEVTLIFTDKKATGKDE